MPTLKENIEMTPLMYYKKKNTNKLTEMLQYAIILYYKYQWRSLVGLQPPFLVAIVYTY